MSNVTITKNAVDLLVQEAEQQFIVQIINVKKMRTASRISCDISDGIYKIRAFITDQKITQDDDNAFIVISSYGKLSQQETMVGIVVQVCQIIDHYTETLGNPQDYLKKESSQQIINKQNVPLIKEEKLKSFQMKKAKSNSPIQKFMEKKKVSIDQISQIPADCEKISELYPDLQNWEIVARLIKKSYRQFISKGGRGKQTKVMNVQLMDNNGMRITGAMFGQAAKQFFESLNEDTIYKVSKGQIREDQYNQNKGKNFSRYTIMLTRNSEFKILALSQNLLSQYQTQLTTISSICLDPQKNEEYDCVGILVEIHDEVQIPKQSKTLYKRLLIICDPENEKIMEAIIWNRNLEIDISLVGKTVGLYGFRLNNYNDSFSLNSSYHSDIRQITSHRYNKFEGTIQKQKIQFFSQRKEKNIQIQEQCKNLKELQNQLIYLEVGKQIKSTMCLTLTLLSYKKWSYESCPYCRKSAEPHNKCNHCEKYIDDTIPRYKLNVQLSDSCGSIWATGFEELGTKLFADYSDGIKYVKNLQENERHRLFEKKQFQQFTVKLTSKLDRENNVKHTVNRVYDINMTNKIVENINRIKGYI